MRKEQFPGFRHKLVCRGRNAFQPFQDAFANAGWVTLLWMQTIKDPGCLGSGGTITGIKRPLNRFEDKAYSMSRLTVSDHAEAGDTSTTIASDLSRA